MYYRSFLHGCAQVNLGYIQAIDLTVQPMLFCTQGVIGGITWFIVALNQWRV